jgi:uncharacterized protein
VFPDLSPAQWTLGAACAFAVGLAKTGVPGFGILVVPLMVLAVGDARQSAGWLLPLLCIADVFAVAYYRRHAQTRQLFHLAPWVLVGMGAGALALGAEERYLRPVVGVIVLAMIGLHLRRRKLAAVAAATDTAPAAPVAGAPSTAPTAALATAPAPPERVSQAAAFGVVAGFATMVANAAGPVMNLYLLAKRLPKHEFIATGAWFFLIINFSKLPVYRAHGLISARSLLFDLVLLPAVVGGALSGRSVFGRLPQRLFETIVLSLTALAALLLLMPRG